MKFLDEILQSISGNTKAKIRDPFIGTFIGSWILCNWNQLAILIWGDGNTTERINTFTKYLKEAEIISFGPLFFTPLLFTIIYLFIFPWFSLAFNSLQKKINHKLHEQAVSVEINKLKQQEALNKQKLLANPEKKFLEQNVQLDIDRRMELNNALKSKAIKRKAMADEAEAKASEAKSLANQRRMAEEKQQRVDLIEKQKFHVISAKLRSAQASNRFPSAYSFMLAIEDSLKEDNIMLPTSALAGVVAAIFGYEDFETLLSDDDFNNEKLSEVVYIKYDPEDLVRDLEKIISNEKIKDENLNLDTLFDHVISTFDNLQQKLIKKDQVEELCRSVAEDKKYDLLLGDELSDIMADSDTIYEEIEINQLESIAFSDGFKAIFSGTASGSHRKEEDVGGRDIDFTIEIKNSLTLGNRALGDFEIGEVSGSFADYSHKYNEQ